jgi:hypothetical protein
MLEEANGSNQFERGTITYMITATLTRPNAISPPIFCDRKVYFVERIDISPLYPPKPRTITLAPMTRRSRAKHQARKLVDSSDKRSRKTDSAEQGSEPPRQSEGSSALSSHDTPSPDSPDPSEMSFDSRLSSRQGSQADSQPRVPLSTSEDDKVNASQSSLVNKVITATIESQAGGCLRGDSIPVKVVIQHTKPVKSVYGVIVTLYRQARVDMHPSIPLGPTEKGKGDKYEDYYPKSMTGLGGLSLTGAGSSHIFRKDLSQIMSPLYINPQTLTQEINTKVRVPDEAFPTISTVPGGMISFKYYVEVIVDIQGRLAAQDRSLSNLSGHAAFPGNTFDLESSDRERTAFTPFGSTIVDTAPIRRDQSVVTSTFEVIIGTRDSERRKGKRKLMEAVVEQDQQPQSEQQQQQHVPAPEQGGDWYDHNAYYDYSWYDQQYWDWYSRHHTNHVQQDAGAQDQSYIQPPPIPLPRIPDESQMTEKERIHQAEQRLLPSQPPGMENGSDAVEAGPTAPYLPGESDAPESAPTYQVATSSYSTPMLGPPTPVYDRPRQMSVVPEYEPPEAGDSTVPATAGDDKQEMQRQQLQNSASAPPGDDNDAGPSGPGEHEASAPSLTEVGEPLTNNVHDSHADAEASTDLPQYER